MLAGTNKKSAKNITDEDSFKKGAWNGYKNKENSVQMVTRSRSDCVSQIPRRNVTYKQTLIHFESCSLEKPVTETNSSLHQAAIQHK
jgi:hypothetical protein